MPIPYCTPEDVVLKLDRDPGTINDDRRESYLKRTVSASQQWDTDTGAPVRTVRSGAPEAPETWEIHRAREASRSPPIRIDLDHGEVNPIDSAEGDAIEVRVGRDTYRDITDEEGDEWVLDNDRGELRIFRFILNRVYYEDPSDRFLRLTYRHGGLGGDAERGYQTPLSAAATSTETTLSVEDATRFPPAPFTALVGDVTELEYVRVSAVDRGTDTLTVTRGANYTTDLNHASGDAVSYAPENVREAVAAKAAELLVINDDSAHSVPENAQLSSRRERAEAFADEYDAAAMKTSNTRTL